MQREYSIRRTAVVTLVTTVIASAVVGQPSPADAPLFDASRSLVPRVTWSKPTIDAVGHVFDSIKSWRSVLIPVSGGPDGNLSIGTDPSLQLSRVFEQAAQSFFPGNTASSLAIKWYKDLLTTIGETTPNPTATDTDKFLNQARLLALVNRIDQAELQKDGKFEGVEARLVYTVDDPNSVGFTISVEFVAKPISANDLLKLASNWVSLSNKTTQDFAKAAPELFKAGTQDPDQVRIRINRSDSSEPGSWTLAQWQFTRDSSGSHFGPAYLDDQLSDSINNPEGAQPRLDDHYQSFLALIQAGSGQFPHAEKSVRTVCYKSSWRTLPVPSDVRLNADLLLHRDVIAIRQCTGCHLTELGASFQHIAENGELSVYLVGKKGNGMGDEPKLADVLAASQRAGTNSKYFVPHDITWGEPKSKGNARVFNDLVVRRLFLATLLDQSRSAGDPTVYSQTTEKSGAPIPGAFLQ